MRNPGDYKNYKTYKVYTGNKCFALCYLKNRLGREPVFYLVVGVSLFGSFSGGFSRFPGGLDFDGLGSAGRHGFPLRLLGRKEFENVDGDDHGV